jgi:hypothetical protein
MGQHWLDGYSAHVEIHLLLDGKQIDIAQIGHGSFILRSPQSIPPGTEATLVIKIDGREEVEQVFLAEGATNRGEPVPFF